MDITDADIHTTTNDIWSSIVGLPVEPAEPMTENDHHTYTGFIHIAGAWEGTVSVECPAPLARAGAAAMFGASDAELSPEAIDDAVQSGK
jgi:hypothetical protein